MDDPLVFFFDQMGNAFDVFFNQYQLPWGISLGMFIVAITLIHFLIDKLLPFLSGNEADKAKPEVKYVESQNHYSGSNSKYMY